MARQGRQLHLAGRNQLRFSNSDPEMARFFVQFLRRCFELPNEQIRISCHLYADHLTRQREIEQFWLDTLGLSESSLRKSIVNVLSRHSERKRLNFLPYGTVHIVVSKTSVTQSIFGAIQEHAGFDRPDWLE